MSLDTPKHSPLPWRSINEYVEGPGREVIADCFIKDYDVAMGNAAFVVRACNSHYDLIAALSECVSMLQHVVRAQPIWQGFACIESALDVMDRAEAR